MTGSLAANDLDLSSGAIQGLSKKLNQSLISSSIHGRGGDGDAKFVSQNPSDARFGSARLEFHRKLDSFSNGFQKRRQGHCCELIGYSRTSPIKKYTQ